jgi:hypothetical protein
MEVVAGESSGSDGGGGDGSIGGRGSSGGSSRCGSSGRSSKTGGRDSKNGGQKGRKRQGSTIRRGGRDRKKSIKVRDNNEQKQQTTNPKQTGGKEGPKKRKRNQIPNSNSPRTNINSEKSTRKEALEEAKAETEEVEEVVEEEEAAEATTVVVEEEDEEEPEIPTVAEPLTPWQITIKSFLKQYEKLKTEYDDQYTELSIPFGFGSGDPVPIYSIGGTIDSHAPPRVDSILAFCPPV